MVEGVLDSGILVSAIVPVYNVEPYLDQCLSSIVHQTYDNLQVIVVDDGSTDGSGALCDSWAARDSRFFVIHQDNRGLSAARNAAIDKAEGDYLVFVDSDDYVLDTFVETLLAAALRFGVACTMCGFTSLTPNREVAYPPSRSSEVVSAHECFRRMMSISDGHGHIDAAPWNRIYARSLFEDEGIRFREGMVYEGSLSMFAIVQNSGAIGLIPDALYVHRVRPDSITQTWTVANALDAVTAAEEFYGDVAAHYPDLARAAHIRMMCTRFASFAKLLLHRAGVAFGRA